MKKNTRSTAQTNEFQISTIQHSGLDAGDAAL